MPHMPKVTTSVSLAVLAAALLAGPAQAYDWKAEPAWISNAGVYRQHELVYQDYLYDDHGANTDGLDRMDLPFGAAGPTPSNPTDPRLSPAPSTNWAGDFTYPSADGSHIDDVADLQEFRVAADASAVHYRIKVDDLPTADSAVVAMCVNEDRDRSTGVQTWPDGANFTASLGCDHLYTVYGTGADVTTAAGTKSLASLGGSVAADTKTGTIEVDVPRSVADPGTGTWRYTVASGMWDAANHAWLAPEPIPSAAGSPVATGGSPTAPNVWDLLSNNHEPNSTWDEEKQANDLAHSDLVTDYLDVDFAKLASDVDEPDPQLTGVLERIHVSKFTMGTGITISRGLGVDYEYNGAWQPYAAVIPSDYYEHPGKLWPYDECLHPLGANHNVEVFYGDAITRDGYTPATTGTTPQTGYLPFTVITSEIDRLGAVYSCSLGRGEGVGYTGGDGLADQLEVEADMKSHYKTDPNRTFAHGVSLGALGSWYVGRMYPDHYAALMPYIFTSAVTGGLSNDPLLANLYNLPVFYAIGTGDEFAQAPQGDPVADQLEAQQDEYVYLHYLGRQHEGRIENDFLPFIENLAYTRVRVENPARVRFLFDPSKYSSRYPGDGSAYWVSGMKPRSGSTTAQVDAVSLARAAQLPTSQVVFDGLYLNVAQNYRARIRGLLRVTPDQFPKVWRPADFEPGWQELHMTTTPTTFPKRDIANAFTLTGTGLGAATLDTARMALDPHAEITGTLDGDGATALRLLGDFGSQTTATLDGAPVAVDATGTSLTVDVPSGKHVLVIDQPAVVQTASVAVAAPTVAGDRVTAAQVSAGGRRLGTASGRRSVRVRVPRHGVVAVRITGRTRSGRAVRIVRAYER
jgi:hypothetical protein